jgi:hypothetical protein
LRPVFDLACEAVLEMADVYPEFFLDPVEVEVLTGYKSPVRQRKWFSEKGWRFVMNGGGRPVVARKYAEKMLGCAEADPGYLPPAPNFGALLRAV